MVPKKWTRISIVTMIHDICVLMGFNFEGTRAGMSTLDPQYIG